MLSYSKILEDLGYRGSNENCHVDPDIRTNIRDSIVKGWKPAFGQIDAAQGYLHNAGVKKDDLFLFFGLFRRVELKDSKYKYVRKRTKDFYLGSKMQIVFGYLQIGEIITNPDMIKKFSWHPHADESRLYKDANALYIPRETLSLDDKLPG
jgi:hypothetical protein